MPNQLVDTLVEALDPNYSRASKRARLIKVDREDQFGEKSDAFMRFTGGRTYGCNIKSFRGNGFNQVTRMTISAFVERFGLPARIQSVLEDASVRVAKAKGPWITEAIESLVLDAIRTRAISIIERGLLGDDRPDLLVLIKYDEERIWILKMQSVLDYFRDHLEVRRTNRGVITLDKGAFFTIQRKGGKGKRYDHIPKSDLVHPGNQVQMKLKMLRFADAVPSIATFGYLQ